MAVVDGQEGRALQPICGKAAYRLVEKVYPACGVDFFDRLNGVFMLIGGSFVNFLRSFWLGFILTGGFLSLTLLLILLFR